MLVSRRFTSIVVIVAMLALDGCSSSEAKPLSPVERTTVTAADNSNTTIGVSDATLTDDQANELKEGWAPEGGLAVGQPVSITSEEPLPAAGIRVSRVYATPLPDGQDATLAYFDEDLDTWLAVPSTLSDDRRTISAVAHHLSLWTDVKGFFSAAFDAVKDTAADAADWAYYQVGKLFDTRVDPPECSGKPSWVDDTTFISTNRNNSLLFCTGADPKQPQLIVVKVRVNRGFAFSAHIAVPTSWSYNSTFADVPLDEAIAEASDISENIARTLGEFAPAGSVVVGAGREMSLGVTEQAVREASGSMVLELTAPSALGFLVAALGQLVGAQLDLMAEGYVAAGIAIANCYGDVKAAHDPGSWTRALITCVSKVDEAIARQLAIFLTKRGRDAAKAGKLAGKIVGKISVYIALLGPVFNTMNYLAEGAVPQSGRSVNIFPKSGARPSDPTSATAVLNLSPVDAAGNLVEGWSSVDRTGPTYSGGLDCSSNSASSAAESGDIYYCSPTAANADVCWVAADRINVYCLYDPFGKVLNKMRPTKPPTGPARHTGPAVPLGLTLDDGDQCRLRNGGSWPYQSTDNTLVGYYRCAKNGAIWGHNSGIDMSKPAWTVITGSDTGPVTKHAVVTAFFVATAS